MVPGIREIGIKDVSNTKLNLCAHVLSQPERAIKLMLVLVKLEAL